MNTDVICNKTLCNTWIGYSNKFTHSLITNAELRYKLSVVGRVNLISIHIQLYFQVHIACLQSTVTKIHDDTYWLLAQKLHRNFRSLANNIHTYIP